MVTESEVSLLLGSESKRLLENVSYLIEHYFYKWIFVYPFNKRAPGLCFVEKSLTGT